MRADELRSEAERKLEGSWRGDAVKALLEGITAHGEDRPAAKPTAIGLAAPARLGVLERLGAAHQLQKAKDLLACATTASRESGEKERSRLRICVAEAERHLGERHANLYRRLDHLRDQLVLLGAAGMLAFGLLIWLLLDDVIPIKTEKLDDPDIVGGVALFGILGGALSGALSLMKGSDDRAIPEVLSTGVTTLFRPVVGAIAGLASYAFLQADLFSVRASSAAYAVAFAAGFSERIVAKAAESIQT
jgi:hypothetical protein